MTSSQTSANVRKSVYLLGVTGLLAVSVYVFRSPAPGIQAGRAIGAAFAPRPLQTGVRIEPRAVARHTLASTGIPVVPPGVRRVEARSSGAAGEPRHMEVQLCQFREPMIQGVDSTARPDPCQEPTWQAWQPIPWQVFAHGEYVGPERPVHVAEYRLRVDDQLEFVYRFTHEASSQSYRLDVGDELVIESLADETLNRGDLGQGRGLVIQPDGTVTLRLLGQVPVAGRTVEEVREDLEQRYKAYYFVPSITVTPLKTNTKLEDLRQTIDSRFGAGGQVRQGRVTPEGTIQLPGIGSVPAHGLSLDELRREVEERYRELVGTGVEVTPVLAQRAPRFVFVLGEVVTPGRFTLEGPTTVMQSIALAGGWRNGGNLREVVVFRRAEDWRLMATRLDLNGALLGRRPSPADEIWLRDSDIVVVPKSPILLIDDFIELVFTRGIYGVVPFQGISIGFSKLSTI